MSYRMLVGASAFCFLLLSGACTAREDRSGVGGGAGDVAALDPARAEQALLTQDDLGSAYRKVTESPGGRTSSAGCLDIYDNPRHRPAVEASAEYEMTGEPSVSAVRNAVASFENTDHATEVLEAIRSSVSHCGWVETTEDDVKISVLVQADDQKSTTGTDDQVNVTAYGTATSAGIDLPVSVWISSVRVDNHLTTVSLLELGDAGSQAHTAYTQAAAERLVAIARGESPPPGAALPSEAPPTSEAPIPGPAPPSPSGVPGAYPVVPLDGGVYTWVNGVTLSLSVELVEPWGTTDDFCGDGSCGVANPDDTRLVLKYEVSVPSALAEPLDPYGCPGTMHVASGNDSEAFSSVAGDYARPLDGPILPGNTKFGVEEYYIEKAYANEEFYIESTCGDTGYSGETAYFQGPAKDIQ